MILFVNACIRGDKSRTLELCREYIAGLKANGEVVREVNLGQVALMPLSAQKVAFRSQLARARVFDDDIFGFAHQFAEADEIIIGAPYWDLTFPAALKVYIEHVSVDGITFKFTPDAHYDGQCVAKRITYICTAGSLLTCDVAGAEAAHEPAPGEHLGYDYICAIARMFGIPEVRYVGAEGLDVQGANINDAMEGARRRIADLLSARPC